MTPTFLTSLAAVLLASLAAPVMANEDRCNEPMANWQPRKAVAKMASEHGWAVRRIKIDDGCYEIYARDSNGQDIEVSVNPATLAIRQINSQRHDKDDG